MAISDSVISAAAGLAGALIGGASTYLANRFQWRRESRGKVYAELIGSSYAVETFMAIGTGEQSGSATNSGTQVGDPRAEFYSRVDSAILLAKWRTQNALHKWRGLHLDLDRFESLTNPNREVLRSEWRARQTEFYESAQYELGVQGRYFYRRAYIGYISVAALVMVASALLRQDEPKDTGVGVARWILILVTTALLGLAFQAAWRWRVAVEHYQGSPGLLHATNAGQIRRAFSMVDLLQIGIVGALACNFLTITNESSNASVALTEIGFFILLMGAFIQVIFQGNTVIEIFKTFRS
jgi:energy-converting hydrogenase Eha subunit C